MTDQSLAFETDILGEQIHIERTRLSGDEINYLVNSDWFLNRSAEHTDCRCTSEAKEIRRKKLEESIRSQELQ